MEFFIDKKAPRCCFANNCYDPLKAGSVFYKELKKEYPQLEKYTEKQIKSYIKNFNGHLGDTIISHRDGVQLPILSGFLAVVTFGKRTLAVDRKASQELGTVVTHKNEETNGNGGGIYYSPFCISRAGSESKSIYKNSMLWTFHGIRPLNKKISAAYKANWTKYRIISEDRFLLSLFKKDLSTYKKKRVELNEFEF